MSSLSTSSVAPGRGLQFPAAEWSACQPSGLHSPDGLGLHAVWTEARGAAAYQQLGVQVTCGGLWGVLKEGSLGREDREGGIPWEKEVHLKPCLPLSH